MPRTAGHRQPLWTAGWASRLLTAIAYAMTMGIVGFMAAGGGDDAPVKSLSAAASEIADDLNEAAIDVGGSSLDAIAGELGA